MLDHLGASTDCQPIMVVVAGQSNALGYTLSATDLPPHLAVPAGGAMIWDQERRAFANLRPGTNTGSPNQPRNWGAEAQFAYRWHAEHPCARLYIVKYARGETGLAPDPARPDWSVRSPGELWDKATAEINAAKAALATRGLRPPLAAVLWMQGETDGETPAKAAAYEVNLKAFVDGVRTRWGDERTLVHIAQIDRPVPAKPGWETVRKAQAAVVASTPGAALIDTDPFERQPSDGTHLTAQGQVRLGDAFYAQVNRQPSSFSGVKLITP